MVLQFSRGAGGYTDDDNDDDDDYYYGCQAFLKATVNTHYNLTVMTHCLLHGR